MAKDHVFAVAIEQMIDMCDPIIEIKEVGVLSGEMHLERLLSFCFI